jgi:hypothetical protein
MNNFSLCFAFFTVQENTSQASPHSSVERFCLVKDNQDTNPFTDVLKKSMLSKDGTTNNGYMTKDEYVYIQIMVPNERWTINEAEQTFYALLDEGKIERIRM